MTEIVNKVKLSKLETLDLEKLVAGVEISELDLKEFLFQGLILKESEFREKLEQYDWTQYNGKYLSVTCSTDAIIPKWAYMLIVRYANQYAAGIFFGSKSEALNEVFKNKIDEADWEKFRDKFVLLKGCSKIDVPAEIYMHATGKLLKIVKKLMYGEACSNVPVFRK